MRSMPGIASIMPTANGAQTVGHVFSYNPIAMPVGAKLDMLYIHSSTFFLFESLHAVIQSFHSVMPSRNGIPPMVSADCNAATGSRPFREKLDDMDGGRSGPDIVPSLSLRAAAPRSKERERLKYSNAYNSRRQLQQTQDKTKPNTSHAHGCRKTTFTHFGRLRRP